MPDDGAIQDILDSFWNKDESGECVCGHEKIYHNGLMGECLHARCNCQRYDNWN